MFSSNQVFEITGDHVEEKSLDCAVRTLVEGFDFKPGCYQITAEGTLCLYRHEHSDIQTTKIEKEEQNVDFLIQLIKLYFNMSAYKTALNKANRNDGGDGSSYPGWRMYVDKSSFYDVVKIAPFWCFYHK